MPTRPPRKRPKTPPAGPAKATRQDPPGRAIVPTPVPSPSDPVARALAPVLDAPPDRHPAAVYLARLSPGSRRAMKQALDVVAGILSGGRLDAATLPWATLRYQHAAALRSTLAERFAPATANKMLAALRGVLRECWRLGDLDAEECKRATDVPGVKGTRLLAGRALTGGELGALFEACNASPSGARDAALVSVLFGCGVRRAEAVALDLADFDPETGALTVRHGKGNKARVVYATNGGRQAIVDWIAVRGSEPGPLLCPVTKGGRVERRRLVPQSVQDRGAFLAGKAGVTAFSPHDARRTFISSLLDSGADLVTVQALAGHASVTTTARYDRRGEEAKRKAAGLLHMPYRGRRQA